MWNKPTREELAVLPPMYSGEDVPLEEKVIHMHFFIGGCDWFAAEYDPEDQIFFGFAVLNGDLEMAEWGNFSLEELSDLRVKFLEVDRDLHWEKRKAKDVELIATAQGWCHTK